MDIASRYGTLPATSSRHAWPPSSRVCPTNTVKPTAGKGTKAANDHFELIVLNDTREAWKGTWKVERVTLAGEVLATQSFDDVELGAVCHIGLPLAEDIVSYGDAGNELVVATPSDNAFARVDLQSDRNHRPEACRPG